MNGAQLLYGTSPAAFAPSHASASTVGSCGTVMSDGHEQRSSSYGSDRGSCSSNGTSMQGRETAGDGDEYGQTAADGDEYGTQEQMMYDDTYAASATDSETVPKGSQQSKSPRGTGCDAVPMIAVAHVTQTRKAQHYNKVINKQVTRMAEMGDVIRLLDVIYMYLPEMNGINLTTAFHRVAKLAAMSETEQKHPRLKQHPVFERLLKTVVMHVTHHSLEGVGPDPCPERSPDAPVYPEEWEMPVQCMSIVTWSCATLRLRHKTLFAKIAWIVGPRIDELKSFELSNLLWAYAKMSLATNELFQVAGARVLSRQPGEFKPQCLSTIAWSFATSERKDAAVFASIAEGLTACAAHMKTQEISNTLWAFAKNRCADLELFNALGNTAVAGTKITQFKSQELSNTVWAFATVGLQHMRLFNEVETAAIRRRRDMVPQNIANILWSYAKLSVQPRTHTLRILLETTVKQLPQHKRQELSTVVWAASQLCPHDAAFFGTTSRLCCSRLKEFMPTALANLTKDLSGVQTDAPECFREILREGVQRLPSFEPAAVCIGLKGAMGALKNRCFSEFEQYLAEAVAAYSETLAPQVSNLRISELQSTADLLWSDRPRWSYAITGPLERAVTADMEARQITWRQRDCSAAAAAAVVVADAGDAPAAGEEDDGTAEHGEDVKHAGCRANNASTTDAPAFRQGPLSVMHIPPAASSSWNYAHPCHQPAGRKGKGKRGAATGNGCQGAQKGHFQQQPHGELDSGQGNDWQWDGQSVQSGPPGTFPGSGNGREAPWRGGKGGPKGKHAFPVPSAQPPQGMEGELQTFDTSCLTDKGYDGVTSVFDMANYENLTVMGAWEQVVYLRYGLLDMRVVLKRIHPQTQLPAEGGHHPHILRPVARIRQPGAMHGGHCVAYMHCRYGNLIDWISERHDSGRPVSAMEAARVVRGVLLGMDVLMPHNVNAITSLQPDEIFIDTNEEPRVRKPLPGKAAGWGHALKWLSPEEATGMLQHPTAAAVWSAVAYRVGLLLYCMGSGNPLCCDPYPEESGETVLVNLLRESRVGGPQFRPDMCAYQGPAILRRLIAACLRIGRLTPPTRQQMEVVLSSLNA